MASYPKEVADVFGAQVADLGSGNPVGIPVEKVIPIGDQRRSPQNNRLMKDPVSGAQTFDPTIGVLVGNKATDIAEMLLHSRPERYDRYFSESLHFIQGIIGNENSTDMDNSLWRFMSEESNAPDSYVGQERSMVDNVINAAHIMTVKRIKREEARIMKGDYLSW